MSSSLIMSSMSAVEFLLTALLVGVFWKRGFHRRFPAMGAYLALRLISLPILMSLFFASMHRWGSAYTRLYFVFFWTVYIANAALLFFICMEVFRSALMAFSGLLRLGTILFRWAAVISLVMSLSTISLNHFGFSSLPDISMGLMRSVSVLELCLLAFLCLSMNALRLTVRDIPFGIAFGFGIMSANDFVLVALTTRVASLTTPLQFVYESVILAVLGVWLAYCALPEPAPKLVLMPANSALYRWNEIASALGRPATKLTAPPAGSFFLTDVERVVDSVLARNIKNSESEP